MIIVNPNLRITQYYKKKKFAITIPNETIEVLDVNKTIYKLLRDINEKEINTYEKLSKVIGKEIIEELYARKIILDNNEFVHNNNVLDELKVEFPLHAITIEVTNACNLNCIHCYGKFGQPSSKKMYTLEQIMQLKSELDKLHTMEVRLSGGECFLNPDFEKIALFFLENGFRVSIYTNGFDTKKIVRFAEHTLNYHYCMGISLDGTERFHNLIRGHEKAFYNVVSTLEKLKAYPNIDILVATAVMRQNFSDVKAVKQMCEERFHCYEQRIFLATPVEGLDFDFAHDEIPRLIDVCPELFSDYFARNTSTIFGEKKHRCQGGVGHGVLTVDGIMKICPIAEEDVFIIGDITNSSLYDVWVNPSEIVKGFRKEYVKSTRQCKKCKQKRKCGVKNCRIEALRLTGNYLNSSPYTCMTVKGSYQE